jgi:predicted neuraminidase
MRTIIVARDAILGPIKNKPVQLPDGSILSPTSTEENKLFGLWKVHFELSKVLGKTWSKIELAPVALEKTIQAIQPSILFHDNNKLQALGRSKGGKIFETWSALSYTNLPNPNSGTDAVTLKNGAHLLVYNHTEKGRSPLNFARMVKIGKLHWCSKKIPANIPTLQSSKQQMEWCISPTLGKG